MRYVSVRNSVGNWTGTWEVDTALATQLNVATTPQNISNYQHAIAPGETFEQAYRRAVTAFAPHTFDEMDLPPGVAYPRIGRPLASNVVPRPLNGPKDDQIFDFSGLFNNEFAVAAGQVANLVRQLQDICQVVHPTGSNMSTYGHEVRNLLVLACTEVEAQWKAILTANHYQATGRFNTNDYIKLLLPLHLADYSARSAQFPWMAAEKPFAGWDASQATGSLPWYDAYNAVKHDREANFSRATLSHAFTAVAACHILLIAQGAGPIAFGTPELHFFLVERPTFQMKQRYHQKLVGGVESWTGTDYPF